MALIKVLLLMNQAHLEFEKFKK